jgi:hypothetical protein
MSRMDKKNKGIRNNFICNDHYFLNLLYENDDTASSRKY